MKMKSLSHVRLLATPWTAAYQAPLSMGFSRQEYWSGVPLPSPVRHDAFCELLHLELLLEVTNQDKLFNLLLKMYFSFLICSMGLIMFTISWSF